MWSIIFKILILVFFCAVLIPRDGKFNLKEVYFSGFKNWSHAILLFVIFFCSISFLIKIESINTNLYSLFSQTSSLASDINVDNVDNVDKKVTTEVIANEKLINDLFYTFLGILFLLTGPNTYKTSNNFLTRFVYRKKILIYNTIRFLILTIIGLPFPITITFTLISILISIRYVWDIRNSVIKKGINPSSNIDEVVSVEEEAFISSYKTETIFNGILLALMIVIVWLN